MTVIADEVVCAPRAGTLYDTLDLILDRGIVIDVFVRVSLVGIEILKIDARVVVASVDTYLRWAEVCNRLDLERDSRSRTVPELFGGMSGGAVGRAGAKKAAHSLGGRVKEALGMDDDDEDAEEDVDESADEDRDEERGTAKKARPRRRAATSGGSGSRTTTRSRSRGKEG